MKNTTTPSVLALLLMCFNFALVQAQNANQASETNQKLMQNLSALLSNSYNYKNYKVIEKSAMADFQSDLGNYVRQEKDKQNEISNKLQVKESTISALESQVLNLENSNQLLLADTKTVSFLGLDVNKTMFTVSMFLLFLSSLVFSGILFLKFQRANEITQSSKSVLKDLEDEYESFRRVCIQREQDLKRKLFDEQKKTNNFRNAS